MIWKISTAFLTLSLSPLLAVDIPEAIETMKSVGPEGAGNAEAAAAWKAITTESDSAALIPLLESMESASPLARNWLRSAVDVIVEREATAGNPLPIPTLGDFLLDTRQSPQARRQAYDLIAKTLPGDCRENDPRLSLRPEHLAPSRCGTASDRSGLRNI